jgi:outer membrane protein assembly factor BamB
MAERATTPIHPRVWTAAVIFPPAGLIRLWSRRQTGWGRKLAGSLAILFYGLIYLAAGIGGLTWFTPLQLEWRGGFPPVLTLHKTVPDYVAVERHRAARPPAPAAVDASPAVRRFTNYWTGFRGPRRDGHYQEMPIRTNWPAEGLKPLWKQPIGGGYASFAVADGRAYTIEQRREDEAITAYDVETGRELWACSYRARFDESMGGEGPRSTPTYDEGRVYALGAVGECHCLDAATGRVLWHRDTLKDSGAANLHWAQSASPLIVGDKLILVPGGPHGHSVVACAKSSGDPIWAVRDDGAAYSSPMLVTLAGQTQLLVATRNRLVGLRVQDGGTLWEFPWVVQQNNRNIAQPVLLGTNRFLVSAGYGTGCLALELVATDHGLEARELWRNRNLKNKFTSSVVWQGRVYGLDEDILTCLDATTGERCWKEGRYGYGQLILASGHLVILCGDGDLALVRAAPDRPTELARFPAIRGKTWNHPAIAGGRLLVRNAVEMACFDLTPPP